MSPTPPAVSVPMRVNGEAYVLELAPRVPLLDAQYRLAGAT
jgi:hypothetical protein